MNLYNITSFDAEHDLLVQAETSWRAIQLWREHYNLGFSISPQFIDQFFLRDAEGALGWDTAQCKRIPKTEWILPYQTYAEMVMKKTTPAIMAELSRLMNKIVRAQGASQPGSDVFKILTE